MAVEGKGPRSIRNIVRGEGATWGMMKAINDAFVNPLLISHHASAIALGVFNSGANLFGFGAGFLGPRLASRVGSVSRVTLACLAVARLVLIALPLALIIKPDISVWTMIAMLLVWGVGEGLAYPLWTSFVAGLVPGAQRGRWLAGRATAATAATAAVMLVILGLLQVVTTKTVLPVAYLVASLSGLASLVLFRKLFHDSASPPVPAARSLRSLPTNPAAKRFLGGTLFFWFGAGLIWPILPPYIINELHAPTSYFGMIAVMGGLTGIYMQRKWGRLGDDRGARHILFIGGVGTALVPFFWSAVPIWWIGVPVELIASSFWPGHVLGLTLRSVELAEDEAERSTMLAWTNLAQGVGAAASPILASVLVAYTGAIPILIVSGLMRVMGSAILGQVPWRIKGGEPVAAEA